MAALACFSSGLDGSTGRVGAPLHDVGAHAEPRCAQRVRQADPGASKRGSARDQEGGGEEVGLLLLHLLIPHAAPTGTDGRAGLVFEEHVGKLVGQ